MTERLLRVVAPHFVAGAIWSRDGASWRCTAAAPILRWMIGMDAETMRRRRPSMERKGWTLEWVDTST